MMPTTINIAGKEQSLVYVFAHVYGTGFKLPGRVVCVRMRRCVFGSGMCVGKNVVHVGVCECV